MLKRFQSILATMVSADMDYAQLDAFLTSQMKKRQVNDIFATIKTVTTITNVTVLYEFNHRVY